MTTQGVPKDWEHFKVVYLDKKFPDSLRVHKELVFQQQRQENMSLVEFVEKFEDMAAYSSRALYAPDERWNINQFKFGVREEYEHSISQ